MGQELGELKMNDEHDDSITDVEMSEVPVTLFPEEIAQTLVDLEAKIDYTVTVANKLNAFLAAVEPMMVMLSGMAGANAGSFDPLSLMKLAASG
jgi:hypothetical protein